MSGIKLRFLFWFIAFAFLLAKAAGVHAEDQPLIPAALNECLPKIAPGMSMAEIEKVVTKAYPKAKARMGLWSGHTGYIDVQLDEQFSISIAAEDRRNGGPAVHKDLLIYVFDHTRKRRLELRQYDWEKAAAAPEKEKPK
ncbi:MAG TPA: hypothetical protein VKS79_13340 [Gemmataceae bacterium]|nr:hypothetical protein [Gemmataceae bacterium]